MKEPRHTYWWVWYLVVALFLLLQVLLFAYITHRFAATPIN